MSLTVQQIEDALRKSGGFVSKAALGLHVTPSNIYARIKRSPRLQEVKKQIDESYLDVAEHRLIKEINSGNLGAICFYLKCKGKKRGYIERQQVDTRHTGEINITNMTEAEIEARIVELTRKAGIAAAPGGSGEGEKCERCESLPE